MNWKDKLQYYTALTVWWSCCLSPAVLLAYISHQQYALDMKMHELKKEIMNLK